MGSTGREPGPCKHQRERTPREEVGRSATRARKEGTRESGGPEKTRNFSQREPVSCQEGDLKAGEGQVRWGGVRPKRGHYPPSDEGKAMGLRILKASCESQ